MGDHHHTSRKSTNSSSRQQPQQQERQQVTITIPDAEVHRRVGTIIADINVEELEQKVQEERTAEARRHWSLKEAPKLKKNPAQLWVKAKAVVKVCTKFADANRFKDQLLRRHIYSLSREWLEDVFEGRTGCHSIADVFRAIVAGVRQVNLMKMVSDACMAILSENRARKRIVQVCRDFMLAGDWGALRTQLVGLSKDFATWMENDEDVDVQRHVEHIHLMITLTEQQEKAYGVMLRLHEDLKAVQSTFLTHPSDALLAVARSRETLQEIAEIEDHLFDMITFLGGHCGQRVSHEEERDLACKATREHDLQVLDDVPEDLLHELLAALAISGAGDPEAVSWCKEKIEACGAVADEVQTLWECLQREHTRQVARKHLDNFADETHKIRDTKVLPMLASISADLKREFPNLEEDDVRDIAKESRAWKESFRPPKLIDLKNIRRASQQKRQSVVAIDRQQAKSRRQSLCMPVIDEAEALPPKGRDPDEEIEAMPSLYTGSLERRGSFQRRLSQSLGAASHRISLLGVDTSALDMLEVRGDINERARGTFSRSVSGASADSADDGSRLPGEEARCNGAGGLASRGGSDLNASRRGSRTILGSARPSLLIWPAAAAGARVGAADGRVGSKGPVEDDLSNTFGQVREALRSVWGSTGKLADYLSSCQGDVGGNGRIGLQELQLKLEEAGLSMGVDELGVLFTSLGVPCSGVSTLTPSEFLRLDNFEEHLRARNSITREKDRQTLRWLSTRRLLMQTITHPEMQLCRLHCELQAFKGQRHEEQSSDSETEEQHCLGEVIDGCLDTLTESSGPAFAEILCSSRGLHTLADLMISTEGSPEVQELAFQLTLVAAQMQGNPQRLGSASRSPRSVRSQPGSGTESASSLQIARGSSDTRKKAQDGRWLRARFLSELWIPLLTAYDQEGPELEADSPKLNALHTLVGLLLSLHIPNLVAGRRLGHAVRGVVAELMLMQQTAPSVEILQHALARFELLEAACGSVDSVLGLGGPRGNVCTVHVLAAALGGCRVLAQCLEATVEGRLKEDDADEVVVAGRALLAQWRAERRKLHVRFAGPGRRPDGLSKLESLSRTVAALKKREIETTWEAPRVSASFPLPVLPAAFFVEAPRIKVPSYLNFEEGTIEHESVLRLLNRQRQQAEKLAAHEKHVAHSEATPRVKRSPRPADSPGFTPRLVHLSSLEKSRGLFNLPGRRPGSEKVSSSRVPGGLPDITRR